MSASSETIWTAAVCVEEIDGLAARDLAGSAAGALEAELEDCEPFAAGAACAPVLVAALLVAWLDPVASAIAALDPVAAAPCALAPADAFDADVFAAFEVAALVAAVVAALIARTDAVDALADGVTLIARTELVDPGLADFAAAAAVATGT